MLDGVVNGRLKKETIVNGFRACVPWYPDAIDYSKCRTVQHIQTVQNGSDCPTLKQNYIAENKYLEYLLGGDLVKTFNGPKLDVIELDVEQKTLFKLWQNSQVLVNNMDVSVSVNWIRKKQSMI